MQPAILVDHRRSSVIHSGHEQVVYNKGLFAINNPFAAVDETATSTRKRKARNNAGSKFAEWPDDELLKQRLRTFVANKPNEFASPNDEDIENAVAKKTASMIPSAYFFQGCDKQQFQNTTDATEKCQFQNRNFLIPPRSIGLLQTLNRNSTADILQAGRDLYGSYDRFDVVVLDPPWTNKSVKRQRRYVTTDAEDLLSSLAIPELLAENGLLVAWYTHNAGHYAQLKAQIAKWNLQLLATWTWIKITTSGLPICPFCRDFKKPYEHVLLASTHNSSHRDALAQTDGSVFMSVPSAVHSHKPNLECLFERIGVHCGNLRCLELYARSLKSNWISVGNEVIKLQCVEMFENVNVKQ